jgi:hypothetical protein
VLRLIMMNYMNWRGGRRTRTRRTKSFITRRRHTSCNNWRRIAILETASRKEHQYLSLCRSRKSSEKAKLLTTKTQLPTVCLDVFHKIFLSGGGSNQLIQPDWPSHRMPDISLLDMTTFIVLTLQMGHDLTDTPSRYWSGLRRYTLRFTARPWHEKYLTRTAFLHFGDNSHRPEQHEEYDTGIWGPSFTHWTKLVLNSATFGIFGIGRSNCKVNILSTYR